MSNVAEIQTAVARLPAADRLTLFHWLEQSDAVREARRTALLADLDAGIAEADRGELIPGPEVIRRLQDRSNATTAS